jgi:hypothetical protein
VVLEQGGALGDEGATVFGPVLVGRADDLDGGHETAATLGVVDAYLVLVQGRQVGRDGQRRPRRRPDGGRHPAATVASFAGPRGSRLVLLVGRHVDLNRRAQVDVRGGDVAFRQLTRQRQGDHGRPLPVKTVPRGSVIERRAEVIA